MKRKSFKRKKKYEKSIKRENSLRLPAKIQSTYETLQEEIAIAQALSMGFSSLIKIEAKSGRATLYRTDGVGLQWELMKKLVEIGLYNEGLFQYAEQYVSPEDRDRVIHAARLETLREQVPKTGLYKVRYRRNINGLRSYYEMNFVRITKEEIENEIFILAMRDVDEEVRNQIKIRNDLERQREIIEGLGSEYFSVLLVDMERNYVSIFRENRERGVFIEDKFKKGKNCWTTIVDEVAESAISHDTVKEYRKKLSLAYMKGQKDAYSFVFEVERGESIFYYQTRVAFVSKQNGGRSAVVATRSVDEVIKREREQERVLQEAYQTTEKALEEARKAHAGLEKQYKLLEMVSRNTVDGFLVDMKEQAVTTIKQNGEIVHEDHRKTQDYEKACEGFARKLVYPEDRESFLRAVRLEHIVKKLEQAEEYVHRYRIIVSGTVMYCQMVAFYMNSDSKDLLVMGTSCIDRIVREEKEQQRVLEEARDMAEAANRAKSDFLFHMSHDIRTPMNAIIGYTDLILKNSSNQEKCIEYLQKIRSSSDFLLSLINNVLEMARIESDKTELNETVVQPGELIGEVVAVYSELLRKKNIEFVTDFHFNTKYYYVDQVKVKEIFLNIISNAYKFTPEGGRVSVKIRELPYTRDDTMVECIISDTGIGMSREFLPRLFDEFSIERATKNYRIKGTGLGMSIVKRLVDKMGGSIEVESEPGKGTTFKVKLPFRIASDYKLHEDENPVEGTEVFNGKRILLAEDNEFNAEIAMELLKEAGFYVERAEDGRDCVERLRHSAPEAFDLILMDVQMPNMDGYMATREIRKFENTIKRNIPIIAMTANAFEEDKKNAMEAGMNGHLAKPIDAKLLMKQLAAMLKESGKMK